MLCPALRVFWPLDLTPGAEQGPQPPPRRLLYGYARAGRAGLAPALLVLGALSLAPGGAAGAEARLRELSGSPLVGSGESLRVLGEWRPAGSSGGDGGDGGAQGGGCRPPRPTLRPRRARARRLDGASVDAGSEPEQQDEQQREQQQQEQQQEHNQQQPGQPWITATGRVALARTGQPMACPGPAPRGSAALCAPRVSVSWAGAWPDGGGGEAGAWDLQVFLFAPPQPGHGHAPALAAELAAAADAGNAPAARAAPQPAAAWMGESPGAGRPRRAGGGGSGGESSQSARSCRRGLKAEGPPPVRPTTPRPHLAGVGVLLHQPRAHRALPGVRRRPAGRPVACRAAAAARAHGAGVAGGVRARPQGRDRCAPTPVLYQGCGSAAVAVHGPRLTRRRTCHTPARRSPLPAARVARAGCAGVPLRACRHARRRLDQRGGAQPPPGAAAGPAGWRAAAARGGPRSGGRHLAARGAAGARRRGARALAVRRLRAAQHRMAHERRARWGAPAPVPAPAPAPRALRGRCLPRGSGRDRRPLCHSRRP
jgi:hypothetical protein